MPQQKQLKFAYAKLSHCEKQHAAKFCYQIAAFLVKINNTRSANQRVVSREGKICASSIRNPFQSLLRDRNCQ